MSTYRVVYPLGRRARRSSAGKPRPRSLDGVTIAELSNHKFDTEFTFRAIERAILKRHPTVKFVPFETFGDVYGPRESDVIRRLPELLKEQQVDLVISGNAG
jgi:hypothetical protein